MRSVKTSISGLSILKMDARAFWAGAVFFIDDVEELYPSMKRSLDKTNEG